MRVGRFDLFGIWDAFLFCLFFTSALVLWFGNTGHRGQWLAIRGVRCGAVAVGSSSVRCGAWVVSLGGMGGREGALERLSTLLVRASGVVRLVSLWASHLTRSALRRGDITEQ